MFTRIYVIQQWENKSLHHEKLPPDVSPLAGREDVTYTNTQISPLLVLNSDIVPPSDWHGQMRESK